MAHTARLRKEAESKRFLAQALDEEERATSLRAAAEAAEKAAQDYRAKAKTGADTLGEAAAFVFGLIFWVGLGLWLLGG